MSKLYALLLLAACGDKDGEPSDPAPADPPGDTGETPLVDTSEDTAGEAPEDTAEDTASDTAGDTAEDTASDTAEKTPKDTDEPPVDADGDGYTSDVDCDDASPVAHPGLAEKRYDGLDNDCNPATPDDDLDGDGYGLAEDCDDADPGRSPGLAEVCDDGGEQDCDGLLDCEDGDCFASGLCGEYCEGAGDEEGDGLADCADDECWGTDTCLADASAQVLGGERWIARRNEGAANESWYIWGGAEGLGDRTWGHELTSSNIVYDVVGELRLPAMSWTCSWGVERASWTRVSTYQNTREFDYGLRRSIYYAQPIARSGFWISGGCPVQTSGFLGWDASSLFWFYKDPITLDMRYEGAVDATNVIVQSSTLTTTSVFDTIFKETWYYRDFREYTYATYAIGEMSGEEFFRE